MLDGVFIIPYTTTCLCTLVGIWTVLICGLSLCRVIGHIEDVAVGQRND
jgi:hypothetical protein